MNIFNKNIFHRTICIFLLLTLCTGLCFEATALPVTMEVGKSYDLGGGYSIQVLYIDLNGEKAWFELSKKGREVDEAVAGKGGSFNFDEGDVFHFDASVYVIAENAVEMSSYNCRVIDEKTLAIGDGWELVSGYSVRVVQIDLEGNRAEFVLNKGEEVVDARDVSGGVWFSLDDGEIFHFDTMLDAVFRDVDTDLVQLNTLSWSWRMLVEEHPPSPPQNFQATPGDGFVDLNWSTPRDDGGAAITDYNIYRGKTSGGEQFLKEVGSVLTYTDTNVINNRTYYYQVRAVNSVGEGEKSEEVPATPTSGVTVPSDPPELKATGGNHEVKLEWKKPKDDGGAPITEYKIYRSMNGDKKIDLATVDGVRRSHTDKNLKNGQTYSYQVSAVNSAGEGKRSHDVDAIPKPDWAFIAVLIGAATAIIAAIINYLVSRKHLYGSISASSNPDGARVFLDGVDKGESPVTLDKIRKGTRIVLFSKSGYSDCEKRVVVNADQITPVHCDLKKLEMKLRLSAEPVEIPADGKSKSVITISVEDEDGTPAPVPEDVTIVLETNIGLIDTPVGIPARDTQATSILTSSTAGGTATVRAESEIGLKGSVEVRFA